MKLKKYISILFGSILVFLGVNILHEILCKKFTPTIATAIIGYSLLITLVCLIIDKIKIKRRL